MCVKYSAWNIIMTLKKIEDYLSLITLSHLGNFTDNPGSNHELCIDKSDTHCFDPLIPTTLQT